MVRNRAGLPLSTVLALVFVWAAALPGCTPWNPLDQVSYPGHASAELAVGGKTYRQEWDVAIRRVGGFDYYDPAGRSESWQITPNDILLQLPDGSAVWIDGDAGTPSPPQLLGIGPNGRSGAPADAAAALEPGRPVSVGVPALWLDSLSQPTMVKLALSPCAPDFPIDGCSVTIRYSVAPGYGAAQRPGMFRHYVWSRRRAAEAFGLARGGFVGGRYFRCEASAWAAARVAPKLSASPIFQPVALSWAENVDLEAHCGVTSSPAWPDAGPKAANGNELGLAYAGNGTWLVPAQPQHTEIFYRLEPALASVSGRPAVRTVKGEFGSLEAPAEWPDGFAAVISATGEVIVVSSDAL